MMFAHYKITFLALIQITIYVKLFENFIRTSIKIVFIPSSLVHFFYILGIVPQHVVTFQTERCHTMTDLAAVSDKAVGMRFGIIFCLDLCQHPNMKQKDIIGTRPHVGALLKGFNTRLRLCLSVLNEYLILLLF
jgi:hypothetical protein